MQAITNKIRFNLDIDLEITQLYLYLHSQKWPRGATE